MDRRTPIRSIRARLAAALAAAALAAGCGGGGGEPTPPALFLAAPAWGDPGAALPDGAVLVDAAEFERLAQTRELTWLEPARQAQSIADTTKALADDLAYVQQLAATDPTVAALLASDLPPAPGDEVLADGNRRIKVGGAAGRAVVHGKDWLLQELAQSRRAAASRENAERLYANFHGQLADDQRADLPAPGATAGLTLDELQQAIETMTQRIVETVPNDSAAAVIPEAAGIAAGRARPLSARVRALSASGCTHMAEHSAVVDMTYALKGHLTPIRSQGRRGTCTSFAVNAAIEARASQTYGRKPDLSEQHLYAQAKSVWAPTPGAFGDGIHAYTVMNEMSKAGGALFALHTEAGWPYNPSPERITISAAFLSKYLNSCNGYGPECSDTNHQVRLACAVVLGKTYCGLLAPKLGPNETGAEHYRLQGHVDLTGSTGAATVARIAAAATLGQPVIIGVDVTECLSEASHLSTFGDEVTSNPRAVYMNTRRCDLFRKDVTGGHSMTVVGVVGHAALEASFGPTTWLEPDGGMYFIVRNSWGCGWGDGGYVYISSNQLARIIKGARAVTSVSAALPSVDIAASKSLLTSPGSVTLTASPNSIVKRVEIYRYHPSLTYSKIADLSAAPYSETVPLGVTDNGTSQFFAFGYDGDGNRVVSKLVAVKVAIPGAPNVWLSATPTSLEAPGTVTLKAVATDDTGIAKVEFIAGLTKLGERTAPPYTWTHDVGPEQIGTLGFVARAWDTDGNATFSTVTTVESLPKFAPTVTTFAVNPKFVSTRGGNVTIDWDVKLADSVTITGLGAVGPSGSATVFRNADMTFKLTAVNAKGATVREHLVRAVPPPSIDAFAIAPTALPPGGGSVSLAWTASNASSQGVEIDGWVTAVGAVPDGAGWRATFPVTATTTIGVYARSLAGDIVRREAVVTVGVDSAPPVVSLAASGTTFTLPGTLTLTATATDDIGVTKVEFLRNGVKFAESTTAPYVQSLPVTSALNGTQVFTAVAHDASGKSTTSAAATVLVAIDDLPPTVSLAATPTVVDAPGAVTLTATASDNVGVARVEFWEGASKLGERTSAPFVWTRSFPAGTTASFTYAARAFDAAGNGAASADVVVEVRSAVGGGDVHVNATSGSDGNAGSAAAPFKTIAKAFTAVGAGGTVWLQNGVFDAATEGTTTVAGRTVPTGVTLRSVNPAGATIGFPLRFAANGGVIDVAFDMSANGSIVATGGNVLVSRPTWVKLGALGTDVAIGASGSAKVTLDHGGTAAHEYFAAIGMARLADLSGSAELLVSGGRIDRLSGGGAGYMVGVTDSARLTLNAVAWTNASAAVVSPTAIDVNGSAGTVTLLDSSIDLTGAVDFTGGGNACIRLRGPATTTTQVTLDASALKACPGDGIQLREGTPTVTLQNGASIQNAGVHGLRSSIFGSVPAVPSVTLNNASISNSGRSGIEMLGGGSLALASSGVVFNGTALPLGGVRLLGSASYTLTMRSSLVQNNLADAGSGGLVLQGGAGSSFDLGTKASPGANNIKFHGSGSTNLRVGVAAGVQVQAVGNTWTSGTQGADSLGRYTSASSVCGGANPCIVSAGSGQNFVVSAGSLRLVDD